MILLLVQKVLIRRVSLQSASTKYLFLSDMHKLCFLLVLLGNNCFAHLKMKLCNSNIEPTVSKKENETASLFSS